MFLYANNADERALAGQEAVTVLVAGGDIPAGTSGASAAEQGLFTESTIPASAAADAALGPNDLESISDSVAVSRIYAGEQIVAGKFGDIGAAASLPIPEGKVAVSVELTDEARVAGFVEPGSTVAVFGTLDDNTGLIVRSALVIGVGSTAVSQSTAEEDNADGVTRKVLTVAVSQQDAQRIINAQQSGEVTFALTTTESQVGPAPRTNNGNVWA